MHLKLIKLVGFKSFVDPTVIPLPSQFSGIVGPNGCGKSNIIDAIRWVIGESSAKQLRGQGMTDVIFNGSNQRKPVGKATVELVFDNNDGRISGEFAKFSEISVRREIHQEGQSQYFLNGTHCRRRDIVDIFLGTGLGPRSYALIEQNMISQLIEAKPEELRVHLEEAAGISKYKERRRETETRIRHTQENLERLNDVLQELEKQLRHLKRQANAAERYQELKQQERLLQSQIRALQWRNLANVLEQQDQNILQQTLMSDAELSKLREIEVQQVSLREQQIACQRQRDSVQQTYYNLGTEMARNEQKINHWQQQTTQWRDELINNENLWQELQENLLENEQQQQELTAEIEQLGPDLSANRQASVQALQALKQAEAVMEQGQQQWEQLQREAASATQQHEIAKTKQTHYQQQMQNLRTRILDLQQRQSQFDLEQIAVAIEPLQNNVQLLTTELAELQQQLTQSAEQIQQQRQHNQQGQQQIRSHQQTLQQQQQRYASLEAVQQAALGQQDNSVNKWLSQQQLQQSPRLAQQLRVQAGWEFAVETVLSGYFDAVCLTDDMTESLAALQNLQAGRVTLITKSVNSSDSTSAEIGAGLGLSGATRAQQTDLTPLASLVNCDWPIYDWLKAIYIADDITSAEIILAKLGEGESVITRDGIWLSRQWLRVSKTPEQQTGVLAREQQLRELQQHIAQSKQISDELQQQLQHGEQQLLDYENQRDQQHRHFQQQSRALTEVQSTLSASQSRLQALQQQQQRLDTELLECEDQLLATGEQLAQVQQQLLDANNNCERFSTQKQQQLDQRVQCQHQLEQARKESQQLSQRSDELALRLSANENQLALIKQTLLRDQRQFSQLSDRREQLQQHLTSNNEPIEEMQQQLQQQLSQRLLIEQELQQAQQELQEQNQQLDHYNKQGQLLTHHIDELKQQLQQLQMDRQETVVRQRTIQEQLTETNVALDTVLMTLSSEANVQDWEQQLEHLAARITRLGPINLAAIDEYQTISERKNYLDKQQADLAEALDILTNAIRKIDRETRAKFRDTYDRANQHFQTLFPRIFPGGKAELLMTDEDLLTAGIIVKAQPPGKRNASVHLLSGGEKALTAIALIFSLFQLNPAPFCILDEVDAPLDEQNVGRFCQLVQEMSQHTQFIVVSHNKVTISCAHQLLGVTMQEAGVSRLVAVDMQQAVALTEAV